MNNRILQADVRNRGLVLDPRTKLLLLITMAVFVLGGAASSYFPFIVPCLCAVPLVLLILSKKFRSAALYAVVYSAVYAINILLADRLSGILYFLVLGTTGILTRFMPSVMMGIYVVSTTTVSEFTAAMQRMHVTEKIIIPLSVMFRLFPTIADEFSSINAAMRMRGISFGGKNWTKMLEYRLIPLMTCSVQIGSELSAAALTRGLGGEVKRTNVCNIGFHLQDIIAMLLCALPYVGLILGWFGVKLI